MKQNPTYLHYSKFANLKCIGSAEEQYPLIVNLSGYGMTDPFASGELNIIKFKLYCEDSDSLH